MNEDQEILDSENEAVNESEASETLKPMGGSGGGESKSQMLSTFTDLLSQLGKDDLSNLYNQTVNQFQDLLGKVSDDSEKNKNTVDAKGGGAARKPAMPMPKLNVKEDIEEIFEGEELSEDLKERASVIFESALNLRLKLEKEALQEQFDELLEEAYEDLEKILEERSEEMFEELSEKLDKYASFVAESWAKENEVAIESNLKTQISEDFMLALRNLFVEHDIDIPEEKLDVVNQLKEEVDRLKAQLDETLNENIELVRVVENSTKESIVEEALEGLSLLEKEKMRDLAESIDYNGIESYREKLSILKEKHFSSKPQPKSSGLIVEDNIGFENEDDTTSKSPLSDQMSRYTSALSKMAKV